MKKIIIRSNTCKTIKNYMMPFSKPVKKAKKGLTARREVVFL